MNAPNFEDGVERILKRDARFHRDSYFFLREALDVAQKLATRKHPGHATRHVSGQELLEGVRNHALEQFGPMTLSVLEEWGVRSCADIGEIVFNMIDAGLLAKTEHDSRADFQPGYDFLTAFRLPFLPRATNVRRCETPTREK